MPDDPDEKPADRKSVGTFAAAYLSKFHPEWSVDRMLTHPDEAKALCVAVRRNMSRRDLEDCVILQSLMNARKRGEIPATRVAGRKSGHR